MSSFSRILPFLFGLAMSVNFVLVWALPVMGMGSLWKHLLKPTVAPFYKHLDNNPYLRSFAKQYIYTKPEHTDFFLISILITLNSIVSLGIVFFYQLTVGALPYWLIFVYYCSWVGIGGRTMGGAYALAHKEVWTK